MRFLPSTAIDQDIVQRGLRNLSSYTGCRLPMPYAGHCSIKLGTPTLPPCDLTTYHTTCLTNMSLKVFHMLDMLNQTGMCSPEPRSANSIRIHRKGHCCRQPFARLPPEVQLRQSAGTKRLPWHGSVPEVMRNLTFEWCEQACIEEPGCKFFSFSLERAKLAKRMRVAPIDGTMSGFAHEFCSLCTHCEVAPGSSFSSWRLALSPTFV